MRWKLPQQYEHIGRPSLSLRRRTRLSHRGHRKKLQEPPFGKRQWASRTSRLSSIAPKPIHTLVMSAVILPSALSRETLAETGRLSSNNLCVMTLTIPRRQRQGEQRDETETHHISDPACHQFATVVPRSGCGAFSPTWHFLLRSSGHAWISSGSTVLRSGQAGVTPPFRSSFAATRKRSGMS
jgi:hypothetical protein